MPHPRFVGPRHEIGGYREFVPPPELAVAAESVWIHRSAEPGMHLVLPDPALNLAFRCRRLAGGEVENPRLTLIGPKTRPYLFHFAAGDEIAAVKVKLEWARALLRLVPADHLDREDELAPADVGLPAWLPYRLAGLPTAEAVAASALARPPGGSASRRWRTGCGSPCDSCTVPCAARRPSRSRPTPASPASTPPWPRPIAPLGRAGPASLRSRGSAINPTWSGSAARWRG